MKDPIRSALYETPCPFCGAGSTELRNGPSRYEIAHLCERADGDAHVFLTIKAQRADLAIATWNRLANFPTNGT